MVPLFVVILLFNSAALLLAVITAFLTLELRLNSPLGLVDGFQDSLFYLVGKLKRVSSKKLTPFYGNFPIPLRTGRKQI